MCWTRPGSDRHIPRTWGQNESVSGNSNEEVLAGMTVAQVAPRHAVPALLCQPLLESYRMEAYRTQFSESYALYVEGEHGGSWTVTIDGPLPKIETTQGIEELTEALKSAYSIAQAHFQERNITETAVPFEQLQWQAIV